MTLQPDLLLTSCQVSQQWTACFWDYTSGNSIQAYKGGGVAAPNTANLIGNDFIITGESTKPLLHIWPVNSQEQLKNQKLILPERASAVSVCPYNTFLSAGIGSKLYIWQISSGKLLCVQQKHLQPITCIRFVDNDFLITGGQDGMLIVYNLGSLVSLQSNILPQSEVGQTEPLYSKLDHSLPITDIHVGNFGVKSRIVSVSIDQTCKIYNLVDGGLLLTIVFDNPLTAVVVDIAFWNIYVGSNFGDLIHFDLRNPPRTAQFHISKSDKNLSSFVGHTKKINCLSLNLNGEVLASGSEDCQVLIWEVKSRQIIRKLEHKGSITNISFVMKHQNIFSQNFKPLFIVKALERSLDFASEKLIVPVIQNEKIEFNDEENDSNKQSGVNQTIAELEAELSKANVVNKQLYDGMIKLIKKYNNVN